MDNVNSSALLLLNGTGLLDDNNTFLAKDGSPYFNHTGRTPLDNHPDENFNQTLVRFGLSVLIVGFVLLGSLSLLILVHRLTQRSKMRRAMARRLDAGEGQYSNPPGELLEEEEDGIARGGVLVINHNHGALLEGDGAGAGAGVIVGGRSGVEEGNPRERLASTQRRPSDYEATSMAKYVQKNSLPQATV